MASLLQLLQKRDSNPKTLTAYSQASGDLSAALLLGFGKQANIKKNYGCCMVEGGVMRCIPMLGFRDMEGWCRV